MLTQVFITLTLFIVCMLHLQAFAKDAKLLPLLKMLITQHAALADTQASELTAEQVKQLQQVVKDSEVSTPEAFKLDADQVRYVGSPLCLAES